ncbi:MAG TPA: HAMP domain-containing sensor histidine kinase [Mobilitalea sp.]|nr:HAMP domain-containing sensor histidine kinase [Mobilitalea sp.]
MKLKDKLFTAFFIMIAMPLMLLSIAAGTIVSLQMNSIQQSYDIEADTFQIIINPIQILNRLTRGAYNEIKFAALKDPVTLEDHDYISKLNEELKSKYSFIAVRKNKEFTFVGNETLLNMIKSNLQSFGVNDTEVDGGVYIEGKNPFLVKAQDFYFSDGGEGTIFVITDLNTLLPQIKAVATQSVISFLLTLCFTAFILLLWIYRSILRPLNILRIAMNQIKDGDLDYSVKSETDDEIGQLCEDFEEMRIRLKELIDSRLAYEEDIKGLISNISHDLKTPLTAIKGYAEGLMDGVADTPQKQEKYLKTIMTKANDMSILVDELAFYAKIDCNTIPYSFKNINLQEYFNDCIEELYLDLEIKKVEMLYENDTDPSVEVVADAEQLKRVIYNIVGNALKYMDKKNPQMQIHLHDIGAFIQVEIEDNGIGIPKADLPYIFDRFYRADASRNSRKGGSGLGLAISKKIIDDHAGKIWAESELGIGTAIFFTLKKSDKQAQKPKVIQIENEAQVYRDNINKEETP